MNLSSYFKQARNRVVTQLGAVALTLTLAIASAASIGLGAVLLAPQPAAAAISMTTAVRNSRCDALVTAAGASAQLRLYSGARPANAGTAASGTLLATLTFGSNIGTCSGGALSFGSVSQTSSSHVSGTPGYARLLTSGGTTAILDIDVCGSAPCWTFTGTVATNQNVTLTTLSLTEGNV